MSAAGRQPLSSIVEPVSVDAARVVAMNTAAGLPHAKSVRPGTVRIADGTAVPLAEAVEGWAKVAHAELVDTAHQDGAVITYGELAEVVQAKTGIRTRMLMSNWMGRVLRAVAAQAEADGEPPLTSLCVHADGSASASCRRSTYGFDDLAGDPEGLAVAHRDLCYRRYANPCS